MGDDDKGNVVEGVLPDLNGKRVGDRYFRDVMRYRDFKLRLELAVAQAANAAEIERDDVWIFGLVSSDQELPENFATEFAVSHVEPWNLDRDDVVAIVLRGRINWWKMRTIEDA
jgi:hypothetical protein